MQLKIQLLQLLHRQTLNELSNNKDRFNRNNRGTKYKYEAAQEKETENVDSTDVATVKMIPKPEKPVDLSIDFSINSEITYNKLSNFRTQEGKLLYKQGNSKQKELDTVLETAKNLRSKYVSATSRSVKDSLGQKILGLENRSFELKNEINQLYAESKLAENEYWDKATEDEKANFLVMLNAQQEKQEIEQPLNEEDTSDMEIPEILVDNKTPAATSKETDNKDLTYKIQIGAYSHGLPVSIKKLFEKLALIRKIDNYTDDRGVVVYTTGNLQRFDDAMVMLKQVQQEGVEDAIIAAYYKGKRIPLTEAKALEGIK